MMKRGAGQCAICREDPDMNDLVPHRKRTTEHCRICHNRVRD